MPRAPVLDWSSFRADERPADRPLIASVQDLPSVAYTYSGRAAIYQALRQLALPPGSHVLVPTYHCPTLVAPVLLAGLHPVYFGLQADGLPDLSALDGRGLCGAVEGTGRPKAIIVVHYFGLPRSLAAVRKWCDMHGVALIEDCAHSHFGQAGERPVGTWGDYATASLSKFFPVPEAGLLGSANRAIAPMSLKPLGLKLQVKGCVDVLEFADRHRRLAGLRPLLSGAFALKNRWSMDRNRKKGSNDMSVAPAKEPVEHTLMRNSNMDRRDNVPLWASLALNAMLPRQRMQARRRENFALYLQAFGNVQGARPLFDNVASDAVPYVFPLWVDDADRVYRASVALELPVFRWDLIWPGTPSLAGDAGPLWSCHVLQLLCHQNLSPQDVTSTAQAILRLIQPVADAARLSPSPPHGNDAGLAA